MNDLISRVEEVLRRCRRLVVAFSGGVDSSVLLALAARSLSPGQVLAVTADSPSMGRRELEIARRIAAAEKVEHLVVATGELAREDYARNDAGRCYFCKQTLFTSCYEIARQRGFDSVAYGFILDDAGDYRPGQRAAAELGVRAPLYEAGLGKEEVRSIARHLALEVWDKPAAPCLASRIPYGSRVTTGKLARIEAMESLLHDLGFAVCRARFDGETMRIEVPAGEIERLSSGDPAARVAALSRSIGVARLEIDPRGFRSGRLNEAIAR